MLHTFLKNTNNDLISLIEINLLDIADIKVANHEAIFSRLETKNNLIESFKANKSNADAEMRKLLEAHPNKKVEELLDTEAKEIVYKMQSNLMRLRDLNKRYAKSVIAVSEFYNSLINTMIPSQKVGYSNKSFAKVDFAESIEA